MMVIVTKLEITLSKLFPVTVRSVLESESLKVCDLDVNYALRNVSCCRGPEKSQFNSDQGEVGRGEEGGRRTAAWHGR